MDRLHNTDHNQKIVFINAVKGYLVDEGSDQCVVYLLLAGAAGPHLVEPEDMLAGHYLVPGYHHRRGILLLTILVKIASTESDRYRL